MIESKGVAGVFAFDNFENLSGSLEVWQTKGLEDEGNKLGDGALAGRTGKGTIPTKITPVYHFQYISQELKWQPIIGHRRLGHPRTCADRDPSREAAPARKTPPPYVTSEIRRIAGCADAYRFGGSQRGRRREIRCDANHHQLADSRSGLQDERDGDAGRRVGLSQSDEALSQWDSHWEELLRDHT